MTLKELAAKYRLRIRLDGCGDPIIPGKRGHIYEHSATQLGVCFEYKTPRPWTFAKRTLRPDLGQPKQDGEVDGTFLLARGFGGQSSDLSLLARVCKLASIKRRRSASPAILEAIRKANVARGGVRNA